MRAVGWLWLLGLAACGPATPEFGEAPAEPLLLRAELSKDELPLLGELTLTLDLYTAEGLAVDFDPEVPEGFRGRVERSEPARTAGGTWQRYRMRLRPVRGPGELEIPAFSVEAGGHRASTEARKVKVLSVLGDAGPELEDPAPPYPAPAPLWPWLVAGGAALAAALLWWWWRRRRRRRPVAVQEPPVPAHVRALRALARLRDAPRRTPEEVEGFYVEVSAVLRRYLEERFGLHAPERTTEEFLAEVEASAALPPSQCAALARFLRQCDLVKFAAQRPPESVHQETLAIAIEFVEATRPDRVREGAA